MKRLRYLLLNAACLLACACTDTYLDQKPRSDLVVPNTLKDFRQLLDNGNIMFASSELPEVMSDDYYLESVYWESRPNAVVRNAHIWATDIYGGTTSTNAWTYAYQSVFYCNVVLDGLKAIPVPTVNEAEWDNIKGSALFLRAFAFYELAQLFAPAFDNTTADSDLGLPLPLVSDVNQQITRGSVRETYTQILTDLEEAKQLLRNPVDYSRPSRPALFGLLARVYLSMRDYGRAGEAADESLGLYDDLTDLNVADRDYRETTFLRYMNPPVLLTGVNTNILTTEGLYESYGEFDLRKSRYFRTGSTGRPYRDARYYNMGNNHYTGIDTDELFLIRAECLARTGRLNEAMADLNHLLKHRFESGKYTDRTAEDTEAALSLVLQERRKELVFRNLRWTDLRRFNKEGGNITLTRYLHGETYGLSPNSDRWIFPIPPDEISASGIQQNPRD